MNRFCAVLIGTFWYRLSLCPGQSVAFSQARKSSTTILRKTIEADLDQITSLLASTTVKSSEPRGIFDWNVSIQLLRAKNSFEKQLLSRLRAMNQALVVLSGETVNRSDACRVLFSNDSFRWQLEQAATSAVEQNAWDGHNFALVPHPSLLQHVMVTACDASNGGVIGFIEVAMLPMPISTQSNSGAAVMKESQYAPCIINLIVSPEYRRRGVGSRLIRNVVRYAAIHWKEGETVTGDVMGLFADKDNEALRLYRKEGFVIHGKCKDAPGRLYLRRSLGSMTSYNRQRTVGAGSTKTM